MDSTFGDWVESRHRRISVRKIAIGCAATAHALAVVGLWVASAWHVDRVGRPGHGAIVTPTVQFVPLRDGNRGGSKGRTAPPRSRRRVASDKAVASVATSPTVAERDPAVRRDRADVAPVAGAVAGTVDLPSEIDVGGLGDGSGGGIGDGNGTGTGTGAGRGAGREVTSEVEGIRGPWPLADYVWFQSRAMTDAHRGQHVMLELDIDRKGKVAAVRVIHAVSVSVDREVTSKAKQFRFKPCIDPRDRPVPCTIKWRFKLH